MNVSINTSTFAEHDLAPLKKLEKAKLSYSLNPFKRTLTEDEVIQFSHNAVGIVAGTEPLTQKVLNRLPHLKVISRCGVGIDNVDLGFAKRSGIKVFSTPDAPTDAVAELTVGVILNLLRRIIPMHENLKNKIWKKETGHLLKGKTVGIIGMGRIGRRVSALLRPFQVKIFYYDICHVKTANGLKAVSFKDLFKKSDIVTLHCAVANKAKALIGANEIKLMKKGSWLINMSRGGVVDEEALDQALRQKKITGAALDVFLKEPYEGRLKELDNVILTPHIGSYAVEARIEMETEAVNNLIQGLKALKAKELE